MGRRSKKSKIDTAVRMADIGGLIRLDRHPVATPLVRRSLTVPGHGYDAARRWVDRPDRVYLTYTEWAGPKSGSDIEADDDGSTFFPRGLLPRVILILQDAGFDVRLPLPVERCRPPRPTARPQAARSRYHAAIEYLARHGGALVGLLPGCDRVGAVQSVLRLSDARRAVVAVPNLDAVDKWCKRLAGRVGADVCDRAWLKAHDHSGRLVVVAAEKTALAYGLGASLLVVPDAEPLLERSSDVYPVTQLGVPAVGLVAGCPVLSGYPMLRAEALFQTSAPVPVGTPRGRVAVLEVHDVAGSARLRRGRPSARDYRGRLDRIAAAAEVLAGYDGSAVTALGLPYPRLPADALRVAVLVESPAQASALAARLGWPVLEGRSIGLAPERAVVTDGWRSGPYAAPYATAIDARAAGPALDPPAVVKGGLVVDVADRWDVELSRRADRRLAAYARAGYQLVSAGGQWQPPPPAPPATHSKGVAHV